MLKVIALHPVANLRVADEKKTLRADQKISHVITRLKSEKSGRLECDQDFDVEIPALDIYAAR